MWALGNEPEIFTTREQRIPLWKAINKLALIVKELDPQHPVMTVLGDTYRTVLVEVDQYCPALDLVGLNAYVDMLTMPEDVAHQNWKRPYVVTEFGPRGHWQVEKTPWGLPIEDNSTAKAEFYLKAYRHAIENRPQCLGSYVFLWAQKQEKTHTWYGLFLPDGSRTGAIDAMTYLWSGHWPANRCPRLGPQGIESGLAPAGLKPGPAAYPAGSQIHCHITAEDPDGDALGIHWDLRKDVSGNPNVGGDFEEATAPIEGAVLGHEQGKARLQVPQIPGNYRLFVYVYDGHGNAATANLPLQAQSAPAR
jgi:hypothetical protein